MQCDGAVRNKVLRNFLRVIAQSLQSNSPGAAQVVDRLQPNPDVRLKSFLLAAK